MDESIYAHYARTLGYKLKVLIAHDPELKTYGADAGRHGHKYKLNPPLSEEELADFEKRFDIALPPEYRAFLKYVGNGGAGPGYRLIPLQDAVSQDRGDFGDAYLSTPFEYTQPFHDDLLDNPPFTSIEKDGYYHGCLCLSHRGAAIIEFLIVSGPCRGQVWADRLNEDGMFEPIDASFTLWYERWIDHSLKSLYADKLARERYVVFAEEPNARIARFFALFERLKRDQHADGLTGSEEEYAEYLDDEARAHFRTPSEADRAEYKRKTSAHPDSIYTTPRWPIEFSVFLRELQRQDYRFQSCDYVADGRYRLTFDAEERTTVHFNAAFAMIEAFGMTVHECGDGRGPYPSPEWTMLPT